MNREGIGDTGYRTRHTRQGTRDTGQGTRETDTETDTDTDIETNPNTDRDTDVDIETNPDTDRDGILRGTRTPTGTRNQTWIWTCMDMGNFNGQLTKN
jgi:hypothetical protein